MVSPETTEARSRRRTAGTLTARQREVLELIARGHTNAQIADRLGISLSAAKWHVSEIIGELGVGSREEAAHWWRREQGLPTRLRRWALVPFALGKPLAIGAAVAVAAAVTLAVVAALWSGGDDDRAIAPDPTDTPVATAEVTQTVPPPTAPASSTATSQLVTHPVPGRPGTIVYSITTGESRSDDRTWPEHAVVVQDLESGNIEATWRYSGQDVGYPVAAVLAGDYVITATERRITRYNLDGTGEFVLLEHDRAPENGITDVAVSPDGALIAFGTQCFQCGPDDRSYFVRVADGTIVASIGTVELRDAGFIGHPWQFLYRSDGLGVFVSGGTGSERPGGRATLYPDGTFTIHNGAPEGYGVISPDGGMVAEGYDRAGECMHVAGARMRVFDHADDTIMFDYGPEGRLIAPWEWSPDGSQLLVLTIPPHASDCAPPPLPQQEFLLLDMASFTFEPVPSVRALHETWYGDGILYHWCEDPSDTNPVRNRYGDGGIACAPADFNADPGDLFLGTTRIASGITPPTPGFGGVNLVGFIE